MISLMQKEPKKRIKKPLCLLSIDLISNQPLSLQIPFWVELTLMGTIYLNFQSIMFTWMIEISFHGTCGGRDLDKKKNLSSKHLVRISFFLFLEIIKEITLDEWSKWAS